jgi:tripartite-type tricarboxylate transporter receptor subunit TctC
VRLIVPYAAGTAPDVIARLLAERLGAAWGQSVFVDNRPGAGGIPGMSALARAGGDSHVLGLVPAAVLTLTPHLYKNPQFNIDTDLTPIAAVATGPMMVVVASNSNIHTLADLVKEARVQSGKINFAVPQSNSVPHLTGEMLARASDTRITVIPYNGSPAATSAVLAGEVAYTMDGLPALTQYVKAGRLRPLAVTSRERLPGFEVVPTVAETFKGFEAVGWFAVYAPSGVPAAVVEQVNRDVNKVIQMPDLVARFADFGVYPRPGSPKALADYVQEQRAIWKKVVTDLNLQPQ